MSELKKCVGMIKSGCESGCSFLAIKVLSHFRVHSPTHNSLNSISEMLYKIMLQDCCYLIISLSMKPII